MKSSPGKKAYRLAELDVPAVDARRLLGPVAPHDLGVTPETVDTFAGPTDVQLVVTLDNLAPMDQKGPQAAAYLPLSALLALCAATPAAGAALRDRHPAGAWRLRPGYRNAAIPLTVTASDGTHTHSLALTLEISGPR